MHFYSVGFRNKKFLSWSCFINANQMHNNPIHTKQVKKTKKYLNEKSICVKIRAEAPKRKTEK